VQRFPLTPDHLITLPPGVDAINVDFGNVLAGDANGDGQVGIADLSAVADNYDKSPATWVMGDFNDDNKVGIADLSAVADNYGVEVTPPLPPAGSSGGSSGGSAQAEEQPPAAGGAAPASYVPVSADVADVEVDLDILAEAGQGPAIDPAVVTTVPVASSDAQPADAADGLDLLAGPSLAVLPEAV